MKKTTPERRALWAGVAAFGALLLPLVGCQGESEEGPLVHTETPTMNDVDQWHEERLERLQAEDGWLSLVGLAWLREGDNLVGRNRSMPVQYDGFPFDTVGSISLQDGVTTFTNLGDRRVEGVPENGVLVSDVDGEPTVLRAGSCSFYVIARGERYGVRIKDGNAETRRSFTGIERFPVDPAWTLNASFEPSEGETIPVTLMTGTVVEEEVAGWATFDHQGQAHRVVVTPAGDAMVFLVFGDRTNGESTYGGGRFLVGEIGSDGRSVILDFNRAYNPPCAFTPFATCPLPSPENRLPFAVLAGERKWGPGH